MKFLFVHQNFPAQFQQISEYLAANRRNKVVAIRQSPSVKLENIPVFAYSLAKGSSEDIHPLLSEWEAKILRAEAVLQVAQVIKQQGFNPDVIISHPGWGETLLLKEIWPDAKYVGYFEYYYASSGQDFNFDPEFLTDDLQMACKLRLKNSVNLHALTDMDIGITPTQWQRNTYPEWARSKIEVIHEGIDTQFFQPDASRTLSIPSKGVNLTNDDEIITYAARYLEPLRGFHIFMRALPELLKRRPNAHVVILGNEKGGYGAAPEGHESWLEMLLKEVGPQLDPARVHILGRIPKKDYRNVLQLSKVHVYLTYPFLLSWSVLEVMATGPLLVASDTPPVREVIQDGKNGLLFDFFDGEAMVNRIEEALKLPTRKANAMRKAARKTIEADYNVDNCMKSLLAKLDVK